jgi:hypothetical protein
MGKENSVIACGRCGAIIMKCDSCGATYVLQSVDHHCVEVLVDTKIVDEALLESNKLRIALQKLVNSLPVGEVELARCVWGDTNTSCVSESLKYAHVALERKIKIT